MAGDMLMDKVVAIGEGQICKSFVGFRMELLAKGTALKHPLISGQRRGEWGMRVVTLFGVPGPRNKFTFI